jgi:hypothetical protein
MKTGMLANIDALTQQYRQSIIRPNGIVLGGETLQLSLSKHFSFDEFISNLETFCSLPPFLLRTTIFPGHNIIIADPIIDFYDVWAMQTIQFFSIYNRPQLIHSILDMKDYMNLETLASLLLCKKTADVLLGTEFTLNHNALSKVINQASGTIAPCFVFPFLEGLIRKECGGIIQPDGTITNIDAFPESLKRKYRTKPPNYKISNISDELLILTTASTNPLKTTIDAIIQEFAKCLNSTENAYSVFGNARHSILHGDISFKGAMAAKYIVFLLFLSKIAPDDYIKNLEGIKKYQLSFW